MANKKRSFADARKEPPGRGLDWAKIREEYAKKATPEELESPFDERGNLKRQFWGRPTPTPKKRPGAHKAKQPGVDLRRGPRSHVDVPKMVELYKQGMTVPQLQKELRLADKTIRDHLRKAGVYEPQRDLRPNLFGRGGVPNRRPVREFRRGGSADEGGSSPGADASSPKGDGEVADGRE